MSASSKFVCQELSSMSPDHYDVIRWHCPKCQGIRGSCMAQMLKEELRLQMEERLPLATPPERAIGGAASGRVWLH
jgi:hypothetical protein